MKLLTVIVFGISSLFAGNNNSEEINFKPRLLNKELSTLLCGDNFRMQELHIPDSMTGSNPFNGRFFTIMCREGEQFVAYIGRVTSCRAGGCSTVKIDPEGEYEYFDYFILFDSQKKIIAVRVYNYEATHGHEIMIKGWLNQFIGFDGTKTLRVGKEVDSISGATISALGITNDVQQKASFLQSVKNY